MLEIPNNYSSSWLFSWRLHLQASYVDSWTTWLISTCEWELWVLIFVETLRWIGIVFPSTCSPLHSFCVAYNHDGRVWGSYHGWAVICIDICTKVPWVPDVWVTVIRESYIALGCSVWILVYQKKSFPLASGWGADIYFKQCNRTLFLVKCRPELLSASPSDWNCRGINRGLRDPPVCLQLLQSQVCSSCAVTHPLTLLRWQDV